MTTPRAIQVISEAFIYFSHTRLKEEVSQGIYDLMLRQDITRTRLAEMLDVDKSRITQILSGEQNLQLETMADIFLVLGRTVHITLGDNPDEYRIPKDEVAKGRK